jgi:hypothetical protein
MAYVIGQLIECWEIGDTSTTDGHNLVAGLQYRTDGMYRCTERRRYGDRSQQRMDQMWQLSRSSCGSGGHAARIAMHHPKTPHDRSSRFVGVNMRTQIKPTVVVLVVVIP